MNQWPADGWRRLVFGKWKEENLCPFSILNWSSLEVRTWGWFNHFVTVSFIAFRLWCKGRPSWKIDQAFGEVCRLALPERRAVSGLGLDWLGFARQGWHRLAGNNGICPRHEAWLRWLTTLLTFGLGHFGRSPAVFPRRRWTISSFRSNRPRPARQFVTVLQISSALVDWSLGLLATFRLTSTSLSLPLCQSPLLSSKISQNTRNSLLLPWLSNFKTEFD
jgi:hypothetical protein